MISRHRSKSVDEFAGRKFDYVLTVCDSAKESCPIFPGDANRLHRNFEDPACGSDPKRRGSLCAGACEMKCGRTEDLFARPISFDRASLRRGANESPGLSRQVEEQEIIRLWFEQPLFSFSGQP